MNDNSLTVQTVDESAKVYRSSMCFRKYLFNMWDCKYMK